MLFPPENYTYIVTDFAGRTAVVGASLPWRPGLPNTQPLVGDARLVSDDLRLLRSALEADYGPMAVWIEPEQIHPDHIARCLAGRHRLIGVDLTNLQDVADADWIIASATEQGFETLVVGRVLGIIHPEGT